MIFCLAAPDLYPAAPDLQNDDPTNSTKKKRNGRGLTKKNDVFSRTPDMPKLKISLNDRGQPIGKNSKELARVIGIEVRKKLSIACLD